MPISQFDAATADRNVYLHSGTNTIWRVISPDKVVVLEDVATRGLITVTLDSEEAARFVRLVPEKTCVPPTASGASTGPLTDLLNGDELPKFLRHAPVAAPSSANSKRYRRLSDDPADPGQTRDVWVDALSRGGAGVGRGEREFEEFLKRGHYIEVDGVPV
jgi:hypothetical protein